MLPKIDWLKQIFWNKIYRASNRNPFAFGGDIESEYGERILFGILLESFDLFSNS